MSIFLDRVNAFSPANEFSFEFSSWIANLIDTLNETIATIQDALNQTSAPQFTTVQIAALAINAPNGTLWYDTTTDQLKAKVNNAVVVLA